MKSIQIVPISMVMVKVYENSANQIFSNFRDDLQ